MTLLVQLDVSCTTAWMRKSRSELVIYETMHYMDFLSYFIITMYICQCSSTFLANMV